LGEREKKEGARRARKADRADGENRAIHHRESEGKWADNSVEASHHKMNGRGYSEALTRRGIGTLRYKSRESRMMK